MRTLTYLFVAVGPVAFGGAVLTAGSCISAGTYDSSTNPISSVSQCDTPNPRVLELPALTNFVQSGITYDVSGVAHGSAITFSQLDPDDLDVHLSADDSAQAIGSSIGSSVSSSTNASISDTYNVLSGPTGSFEWIFQLDGTASISSSFVYGKTNASGVSSVGLALNGNVFYQQPFQGDDEDATLAVPLTVTMPYTPGVDETVTFVLATFLSCGATSSDREGDPSMCTGDLDFSDTAQLVGFHILDANGNIIDSDVVLSTGSGFDYRTLDAVAAPEPGYGVLVFCVLGAILLRHKTADPTIQSSRRDEEPRRTS
jgi:hypothetical protein